MSDESPTDPPVLGQKLSKSASPPQGEASIPRASAPASTGCLLLYWDAQEYRLLSARGTCPGTTQGSGAPACIRGANADLPGGWYKKPAAVLSVRTSKCWFLMYGRKSVSQEKVSRNWPLVCLELLDRCPETEDRMETIKVAAREIPEGVTRLSAPLRFRAERTERSTRGRPPCPGTLAGLAERSPGGAEERPTPCYAVHPLFPSSCCPQQSWAVNVRTASSRTSQTFHRRHRQTDQKAQAGRPLGRLLLSFSFISDRVNHKCLSAATYAAMDRPRARAVSLVTRRAKSVVLLNSKI